MLRRRVWRDTHVVHSSPNHKPPQPPHLVEGPLWAASFGQLACCDLERSLGACPVDEAAFWTPLDHWDADDIALEMTDAPNIWTDGNREDLSSVGGFEVAGAGV